MEEQDNKREQVNTVNVSAQVQQERNPLGTAGFILALIQLFLSWIPFIGWVLWVLGAIFSVVGLFRRPKGLAIAGTVISFIGLILIIFLGVVGLALFSL